MAVSSDLPSAPNGASACSELARWVAESRSGGASGEGDGHPRSVRASLRQGEAGQGRAPPPPTLAGGRLAGARGGVSQSRAMFLRNFKIFGGRFGEVGADFGRSRRRGWIREGRVRPGISPRGPGLSGSCFSEFVIWGRNHPECPPQIFLLFACFIFAK